MLLWLDRFGILALGGLAVLLALLPILWWKTRSWTRLLFFCIFWVYLLFVVGLTLLPMPYERMGHRRLPAGEILSRVYLVPYVFRSYFRFGFSSFVDLFGNILLTIPFGLLLPLFVRFTTRNYLRIVFLPGLAIELSQLIISLIIGWNYRKVDITDVFTNTIGALVGYGFFLVLRRTFRDFANRTATRTKGVE